jgi:ABC-2 type transport system permease protein
MILLMTSAVFLGGYYFDHIILTPVAYLMGYLAAFTGGAVYLGLGQMIVGLIKNAETVHSTSRLIYFVFIMVGMFGELGILGNDIGHLVKWSPYGTVHHILTASFTPGGWDKNAFVALAATLIYAVVFSFLGIRWFRWNASK